MLVHICCSVDSHYFLSQMQKLYPQKEFVGFFYNPNIHPKSEHDLRLLDVKRSCEKLNIKLIEGKYDSNLWLENTKGLEEEPEKGKRCEVCFDTRLLKTAHLAKKLNIKEFTTTLLSSPLKTQNQLYAQGDEIAKNHNLDFIKINVRQNGGVEKQNALAKEDNLYRQNYCGCIYALNKQRNNQNKFSLEMLSAINKQTIPGSIEHRIEVFEKRNNLEKNKKNYILAQQKNLIWRLLSAKIECENTMPDSYIIARSSVKKNAKTGNINWIKQKININEDKLQIYKNDKNMLIGYSKKDDSIFVNINLFNLIINGNYKNTKDLLKNPPSYEMELFFRAKISQYESINPIIIVDSQIANATINIESIFQEENIFNVIEEI